MKKIVCKICNGIAKPFTTVVKTPSTILISHEVRMDMHQCTRCQFVFATDKDREKNKKLLDKIHDIQDAMARKGLIKVG